jgi:hypothetical protein
MPDPTPDEALLPAELPDQTRADLHALVDQLTDEAARALWHLLRVWVVSAPRRRQQRAGAGAWSPRSHPRRSGHRAPGWGAASP